MILKRVQASDCSNNPITTVGNPLIRSTSDMLKSGAHLKSGGITTIKLLRYFRASIAAVVAVLSVSLASLLYITDTAVPGNDELLHGHVKYVSTRNTTRVE